MYRTVNAKYIKGQLKCSNKKHFNSIFVCDQIVGNKEKAEIQRQGISSLANDIILEGNWLEPYVGVKLVEN